MKYRKRVEKPQGPVSPPLIFWGGAGKAYALLIAAGLLGASPAGARSSGSGPRVEGGRVVVTDDGFSRDDARDNGLADRFEVAREDAPREMTAAEASPSAAVTPKDATMRAGGGFRRSGS